MRKNDIIPGMIMLLVIISLTLTTDLFSQQTAEIRGTIVDSTTREPLVGATILVSGTSVGASADLDGKYTVKRIPAGTYDLKVSMIGYGVKVVKGLVLKAGESATLDIGLSGVEVSVDEVVVTADAVRSTESAMLMERKKSDAIGDGMSEEQIKKTPDANTADVVKRIPSVTIVDNKYLQVRGSSERYNGAMLNNTSLSSTEPEKKSFAFDIIPSNLIENTVLTKSFTPDLPGDFSGGLLKINTVDFPSRFTLNLAGGTASNSITTNQGFLTYSGGDPTYGSDAGIRNLPPDFPATLSGTTVNQKLSSAQTLLNIWAPRSTAAPYNANYSIGVGNQFTVFGQTLGVVASALSRSSYEHSDIERNDYESTGDVRFEFAGTQSKYSVISGGVANIGLKLFDRHKISFKNTLTRSADDEVISMEGPDNDGGFYQRQTALRYVSREIFATQLIGQHSLPIFSGIDLDWKAFRSLSLRNEPDYRRVYYARDIGAPDDPYFAVLGPQVNLKNGGRYYSDLNDEIRGAGADLATPILGVRVKAGGLYEEKKRDFSSRLIGMLSNAPGNGYTDFALLYLPIDSIFAPENFRRNGFSIDEYQNGTNNYTAGQTVRAGYAMLDHQIVPLDLRVIVGARVEHSSQTIRTRDLTNTKPIEVDKDYTDVLPSLNLVYSPWTDANFRAAYSQTINRPELRELAPFSYYDFSTQFSLTGNPYLSRALIRNYDVRVEVFTGIGEVVSASVFYKAMTDAIEQVVKPSASLGSERTFLNSEKAKNYGFEIEARKTLAFIGDYFDNFAVNLNYAWIRSEVNFDPGVSGVETRTRPLQGQSDYVVNAGLTFTEPDLGTSLSVYYNRFGNRISEVSTTLEPDVIEQGRNVIDFVLGQNIGQMVDIKLSMRDILHESQVYMQGDKVARKDSKGTGIALGMSVKF